MILGQLTHEENVIMDQLVDEDALAIPEGPNTCSRSKKLNEADGGILKMSRKQEDCLGTMARDREGGINTTKIATLQKIMKFRMEQQQKHDEHMQKRRMHNQELDPKPPDSVQYRSSKHKCYKEEEPGRKGDYFQWERTMDRWLWYNRILKKERLAFAISQLKGNAYKWWLQEEDDRRFYKEPAITTWESLKLLLRDKYASKGHTSLKSPKKKVISATDFKSEKSETKMADYEKEISSLLTHEENVIMDQLVDEDALAIPEGPNTCSRSKKLNEADGGILKMSRKQEDCLGTMARDREGGINTTKIATLQKIMKFRMEQQQKHDEHMQKRRMHNQELDPKPPDSVQYRSSKHKCYKEEEPGRKGDYFQWERTMDRWLWYNRILKKERLAFAISQLKGNAYKWWLQEEDDRRFYKEPAITTWESLKLLLRDKYASKGHTSLKSPKKKVISATDFKSEKSETKMADYEKEISSLLTHEENVIMDQLVDEDALAIPEGPNTCSRSKKLNEADGGILKMSRKQEDCLGTMARDREGGINTAKIATLQKIMKFIMEQQQIHDEHMQKRRMHNQELDPKPPDSVQYRSSKHKCYKEEEPGRGQQSLKQPANTLSQYHQTSLTPKSIDHFSKYKSANDIQLYSFSRKGDYFEWERTMDRWLWYNRILKKERLAFAISQLKGNAYKWWLQEEDDRRFYKEPAITTWESLKLLLRDKYASKGHTSLKSPKKKVISATDFKSEKSETKMADYEKEISSLLTHEENVIMDQLVDEDALAIPEGPNTCSRSKKLNEADGGILKMSRKQEDCLGTMARDREGGINTAKIATLQKIMKFRMEQQQIHDEHMQKRRMHNQELEPKPPDSVQYRSSKHKCYKEEEPGRKGDYFEWERTMDRWLWYNRILKKERLAFAISQLKRNAYKWWLQEEDDRRPHISEISKEESHIRNRLQK
ncbi:hypothetical protein YC2023_060449 [Brassica napus]